MQMQSNPDQELLVQAEDSCVVYGRKVYARRLLDSFRPE